MTSRSDAQRGKRERGGPPRGRRGGTAPVAAVGYSGTPLVKKLGFKAGDVAVLLGDDGAIRAAIGEVPDGVEVQGTLPRRAGTVDIVLVTVTSERELVKVLQRAARAMKVEGMVWVCWPKKASGVVSDVTEDVVRAVGLERGLVDVKVCAVTAVWSGLKFVVPLKSRGAWAEDR